MHGKKTPTAHMQTCKQQQQQQQQQHLLSDLHRCQVIRRPVEHVELGVLAQQRQENGPRAPHVQPLVLVERPHHHFWRPIPARPIPLRSLNFLAHAALSVRNLRDPRFVPLNQGPQALGTQPVRDRPHVLPLCVRAPSPRLSGRVRERERGWLDAVSCAAA
eukprot:651264-Rhodomonas_salina.1